MTELHRDDVLAQRRAYVDGAKKAKEKQKVVDTVVILLGLIALGVTKIIGVW